MKPLVRLCAMAAVATGLGACSTVPPTNDDLEAARSALANARADPFAARSAAVDLERAQAALRNADAAWADRRDSDETRHLAYLARRRAETVLALASQARSEERLQLAGAERERARLEARTREAELAGRVARAAQADAQSAQAQAQTAQSRADDARSQAERARLEAESTRQQLVQQSDVSRQQAERAAALERDLLALQARPTPRGMVVTLGDVLFATGRDVLQPGAMRSVQQIASVLREYPERRILVEGFTDSVGSESSNLELSRRRAEAFRRALLEAGVAADRIELRALGQAFPVADNASAAGRQQNRRVEVLFSDGQGRFAQR